MSQDCLRRRTPMSDVTETNSCASSPRVAESSSWLPADFSEDAPASQGFEDTTLMTSFSKRCFIKDGPWVRLDTAGDWTCALGECGAPKCNTNRLRDPSVRADFVDKLQHRAEARHGPPHGSKPPLPPSPQLVAWHAASLRPAAVRTRRAAPAGHSISTHGNPAASTRSAWVRRACPCDMVRLVTATTVRLSACWRERAWQVPWGRASWR